jgi:hypothetical protein
MIASKSKINGVEEGAEIQIKGIENWFNETIKENRHLESQTDMIRKQLLTCHIIVNMQGLRNRERILKATRAKHKLLGK